MKNSTKQQKLKQMKFIGANINLSDEIFRKETRTDLPIRRSNVNTILQIHIVNANIDQSCSKYLIILTISKEPHKP